MPMEIRRLLRNKPGIWDLPELPDIGGPTSLEGEIQISQQESALAIGAKKGWYGVNGATGLLQAALLALVKPKQSVLMPRNIHKCIINACLLGDMNPVLFDLPFLEDRGHFVPPNISWFKSVLQAIEKENVEISAVVLTNPFYQGYAVDLKPFITLLHEKNWPVLIDEAHGAYFSSNADDSLPESGLQAGADLVVHSLHKSANGLVQTAALWWQGNLVDPDQIERSIVILQTTSPSALLLASCEAAIAELTSLQGKQKLKKIISKARELNIQLRQEGLPLLENQDPLKLILHTASIGINGMEADSWLISKGMIAELPEPGTITFCLGFAIQRGLTKVMKNYWDELLSSNLERKTFPPFTKPNFPLITILGTSCLSAFIADTVKVPLEDSIGRISSDLISPYPPGIPILFPGELLDQNRIDWMIEQRNFWPTQIPSEIKVIS
ncbi:MULTISPECIES: aminotransferase class I/II-fold pyridoxal phosphate-dependent enzyme [Prochlorococcus]|uniref:Lysine decarboxylase n=1 Tax=Prochlorococcus marinus (strain SARG / CCMP1375 / SS120) TaxID=167539 RepID=Q7VBI0_PROMA|nr:Lysine decarboxylase [Prochlorococcus marinus subsp. marinus str. CCMP1375]